MTKTESYQMHKKDGLCRREKKKEGAVMYREHTKTIKIGNQVIGGGTSGADSVDDEYQNRRCSATVAQILTLEKAGCQIIRCAVPTMEAARALGEVKKANSYSSGSRHSF